MALNASISTPSPTESQNVSAVASTTTRRHPPSTRSMKASDAEAVRCADPVRHADERRRTRRQIVTPVTGCS
ncbi:hypothetical protein ACU686_40580 [Yinghuangia aomiensis]